MPTLSELEDAAALVHQTMPPTPERCWPLLAERYGCELWVKHENHTPIGSFKIRGGLVYMAALRAEHPNITGVIAATRGNHGQSVAFAATRAGLIATVVAPHGNSVEKNRAMRALGADLIEHGDDFHAAYAHALALAEARGQHLVRSYDPTLVLGVASYSLEFLRAVPDLETLYVPIGLGSGICGAIAARDALGAATRVVGVVAANAPTYAKSFAAGKAVPTPTCETFADGVATRIPDADSLALILKGAERVVAVSETAMQTAIRDYFTDTHNIAEGAGAATLAAVGLERDRCAGRRVGVILSGGNIDGPLYRGILGAAS
jgi:threonine dehydratase